ncbi:YeiH family protein [Aliidiomarina quisquiliarum]|uniref:YeiH family protein n=1 Tax=Aliidiomarina quisquiliarum TaxID=2938947 RepID=UPI00208F41D8|nr:putative sulfate exporter family transporter [Aliidiomarina quisquiliarum]MCO4321341.1 putative sulfate exporter family transporter [Aliidiomarina quisquiliarum]
MQPQVISLKHIIFVFVGLLCLTPLLNAPVALLIGLAMALAGFVPSHIDIQQLLKRLLAWSIVGMGFGVSLSSAMNSSLAYLPLLVVSILATLLLASLGTRLLKIEPTTGTLIGAGTAICGGSAIAAVAAAIQANSRYIGVALGCVSLLNATALWIFPWVGQMLELSQQQFGVWAALAIHDTSSVVGAAGFYGNEALELATTLKLTRALAIVPLALTFSWWYARTNKQVEGMVKKPAIPFFIVFYVIAMLIAEFIPQGAPVYSLVFDVAKSLLVVCLYLVGASLSLAAIKAAGLRPMLLAIALWVVISAVTLSWVYYFI